MHLKKTTTIRIKINYKKWLRITYRNMMGVVLDPETTVGLMSRDEVGSSGG